MNYRIKRIKIDLESAFEELAKGKVEWKKTTAEGLDLDYALLFRKSLADELMFQLQENVEYYDADLSKVKVFGKWHQIPRQQAAYGDKGTKYHFSGITLQAKPWIPPLEITRNLVAKITGVYCNFVLVNRYRNGSDHIGEHKDGEKELDKTAPIISISLGQCRQFVLKHEDNRKRDSKRKDIPIVKKDLQHGSILLMNPPTNRYWCHSVPPKKSAPGVRINLTFRKLIS